MDITSEFNRLLMLLIEKEDYAGAKELIKKSAFLKMKWDAQMYYGAAIVAEYEGLYGLVTAFLKQAIKLEPENEMLKEYFAGITFGLVDIENVPNIEALMKHKRRVLTVKGVYDALDVFTDEFVNVLEFLGYDCFVFDVKEQDAYKKLADFMRLGNIDIFFYFNNLGLLIKLPDEKHLASVLKCNKINILVDHPAFTIARKKELLTGKDFIEYVVDREHVEYLDNYQGIYSDNRFLPHGGKALNMNIKSLAERSIDVLYVGATKDYPMPTEEICIKCVDAMIENCDISAQKVIRRVLEEEFLTPDDDSSCIRQESIDYLHANELVALGYYRTETIRCLVEAGVKVEVHGPGWEGIDFADNPNLIIGDGLTPVECLEKMYDSKIVLNSMPWFKDGTHERIFNAMLAGSIAVTDQSKWLNENLRDGENVILFDLKEIDKMVEKVKLILANPEPYQNIADNGYKEAVAKHTWSHRVMQILDGLQ